MKANAYKLVASTWECNSTRAITIILIKKNIKSSNSFQKILSLRFLFCFKKNLGSLNKTGEWDRFLEFFSIYRKAGNNFRMRLKSLLLYELYIHSILWVYLILVLSLKHNVPIYKRIKACRIHLLIFSSGSTFLDRCISYLLDSWSLGNSMKKKLRISSRFSFIPTIFTKSFSIISISIMSRMDLSVFYGTDWEILFMVKLFRILDTLFPFDFISSFNIFNANEDINNQLKVALGIF